MNRFRNMTELNLYRQKLKYKELLAEKELTGNTADLVDHFSNKLRDAAFDLGMQAIMLLFKNKKS